ncbi:MAG: DUF938 domain-containing protein [Alphaproteobacteria bacterium]|nr:DUF938 domain-containing protein [Alphaproteobacteria bacterium]
MSAHLPFSQAAENNKGPIADLLCDTFSAVREVLEIGSGTGQHAVYFGQRLPHLTWRTSDLESNLADIQARLAVEAPANVLPPIALDVAMQPWPVMDVDGVFSANAVHIMSWDHVTHMFRGIGQIIPERATICLYGPFKYKGDFTTPSNAQFDLWLKQRYPRSGVRDFEAVDALARAIGLRLVADHPMPANNQLLVWRRG